MNIYQQIASNKRRSWLLVVGMMAFIAAIVYTVSYIYTSTPLTWLAISFIFTGIYSLISYYQSSRMILALSGAKKVSKAEATDLFNLVENLCLGAGLPMPEVYVIDDTAPNAFATGRDPKHAAVCFTTGILAKLNRQELEGVVAHELSHIKNYDTRLISLAVILVGVVALLSDLFLRMIFWGSMGRDRDSNTHPILGLIGIALAIVAPIVAVLMQLAISRQREYLADASAALLTRYPEGLARALDKIGADHEPLEAANNATASLYIANPLKDDGAGHLFSNLFNTHPPIAERIERLRQM